MGPKRPEAPSQPCSGEINASRGHFGIKKAGSFFFCRRLPPGDAPLHYIASNSLFEKHSDKSIKVLPALIESQNTLNKFASGYAKPFGWKLVKSASCLRKTHFKCPISSYRLQFVSSFVTFPLFLLLGVGDHTC